MDAECGQYKHMGRFSRHILSQLVCMGRHTMTNLLKTGGWQFVDWTADYRMYCRERFDAECIFSHIRKEVAGLNGNKPLITALDDSLLHKTGRKIPGVRYARDSMGPPFTVNFIRGQRVIQMSAAVSQHNQARMIPVMFRDASTPEKPRRNASQEAWSEYHAACKTRRLSVYGSACIKEMHSHLADCRDLWVTVDGSYTNKTVLNNLPDRTVIIGRVRSDAKLFYPPQASAMSGPGRKKVYGAPASIPDEIRIDDTIPWQTISAFTSGRMHEFKVKVLKLSMPKKFVHFLPE